MFLTTKLQFSDIICLDIDMGPSRQEVEESDITQYCIVAKPKCDKVEK